MYKIIASHEPDYLFNKLSFGRMARTRILIIPRTRLKSYDGDFFVQGVKLWNNLPIAVRNSVSYGAFRTASLSYFKSL